MIGPGDLIALVTFDGQVYANQAVTRERLGRPPEAAHALTAALAHWLRRRHVWIVVEGRRIQGIATARALAGPQAWEIDTLVDAGEASKGGGGVDGVVRALLEQAQAEAQRSGVRHLLMRVAAGAPAEAEAVRAGFARALRERLWRADAPYADLAAGDAAGDADGAGISVREAIPADAHGRFLLYCRALSVEARSALAMTLEEWRATREVHWLGRHPRELVAAREDRIVGAARIAAGGGQARLDLLATAEAAGAARALLAAAGGLCARDEAVLALAPLAMGAAQAELLEAGFEPAEEYVLLSRRVAQPVEEAVRVGTGVVLSGG